MNKSRSMKLLDWMPFGWGRTVLVAIITACVLWSLISTANAQTYNVFSPGGDLNGAGSTWNAQFVGPNNITNAKLAQASGQTFKCQNGASSGIANITDCVPLAGITMMSAQIDVTVTTAATGNVTLSGLQNLDGQTGVDGQIVGVFGQTTISQNGIYIMHTGAWTRTPFFPSGYVLPQFCVITVNVQQGNTYAGSSFFLDTSTGSINIGTTAQNWGVTQPVVEDGSLVGNSFDCIASTSTANQIGDLGNINNTQGSCIIADINGHPILAGNGSTPTVTGTGCVKVTGSQDNHGSITATGVDTCTLAFGSSFANAPFCSIGNHGATVLANLTAAPTTAHAIFATAAAGTFDYICL